MTDGLKVTGPVAANGRVWVFNEAMLAQALAAYCAGCEDAAAVTETVRTFLNSGAAQRHGLSKWALPETGLSSRGGHDMIDVNKYSETGEALPLLDVLSEVLEQMHSGALPASGDPGPTYLIGNLRSRYAGDEEVQRLCAWTENQMGALGEMVGEVIGFLREEVHAELG